MKDRPNPLQWAGYAYGRVLPASMRDWVARDLCGRGAFFRHLARNWFVYLPIYVGIVVLLPGPLWLRLLSMLLGFLVSTQYTIMYRVPNRRRRLMKHGLPEDLPYRTAARAADRRRYDERHGR